MDSRIIRSKGNFQKNHKKKGFALVASLTLMMLLGLIAVGVLSMASTQNRLATHAAVQAEARQNALIGLDAALAEMQYALGPDQRVTATSGIISQDSNTPQHVLGVWNSWTKALYDRREGNIINTYSAGRRAAFRRWLISSRRPEELSNFEAIQELSRKEPGRRICMVGEGTLGRNASPNDLIYADLVELPSSNKNTGNFAWWVSGENQKANATIKQRPETNQEIEILHRTWDTPPPSFSDSIKIPYAELTEEEKDKLISIDSITLPGGGLGDKGACFHDVTTYSYSLPINVRDGGLKHDLNLLLNKKDLKGTPFAPRANQDCPLADDDAIPAGSDTSMPIGSWQVLHAYYNTWPDGSDDNNKGNGFSARLSGSVREAYTRMSGHLVDGSIHTKGAADKVTLYDTRTMPGDDKAGYARTPIMLSFLGAHGLAIGAPQQGWGGNSYGLSYAPYVQWWNPYNVRMHVGSKKLWTYSLPYRTMSILIYIEGKWKRWPMLQPNKTGSPTIDGVGSGQRNTFANDWGNYFVNSEKDGNSDIVFEPGEILVFSMSRAWNNLDLQNVDLEKQHEVKSYSQPQSVPFVIGDNVGSLYSYFISMYSYGDHNHATLGLSFETKELYQRASNSGWITTRIDQGDGQESNFLYLYDVVGDIVGPGAREIFSVIHGYDGIDASEQANQSLDESRRTSKPNRFCGAGGVSPYHFALGWYDYDEVGEEGMKFCGQKEGYTWTENMQRYEPVYFAAIGIVPKSYNPNASLSISAFRGKDYRTKVWQHSNPALGSSALYRPDDQERQYNPFQLAGIEMGSGLGRGSLDTVNNRNGVYGTMSAGNGGGESASFISVLELPYHPPFSLAGFAGMRLSPGWYSSGDNNTNSLAEMRRMQYQAGVPGVGIGNSFADPCLPADDVYAFHNTQLNSLDVSTHKKIFSDFYDHALLINDALWDRYFCSSVSDMPHTTGKRRALQVLSDFMEDKEELPVSRYKKNITGQTPQQVVQRIMSDEGWMHIARYLWIEGGFNVNSISEEAWAATLRGLAKRNLLTNAGGSLKKVSKRSNSDVLFSRFMVSTAQQPIDSYSFDPLQGSSTLRPSLKMATAWGEIRSLTPEDIRLLSQEIVKKVRERGPFLNMSDFINRRLDGGSNNALTGALQAAIDATNINQAFTNGAYRVNVQKNGSLYKYQKAAEGSMYTAAPGYLIQSDVLASLGNILTVRDDTFTVRAYGCVRNARRAVLAQAWCEATVQRTIDYVDSTNAPEDSDRRDAQARTKNSSKLTEINRIMGRKLRVIAFRWLDSWDI